MNLYIQAKDLVITSATIFFVLCAPMSCTKMVEVPPPISGVTGATVFNSDANAVSTVTGLYAKMSLPGEFATGSGSISVYAGLSADELSYYGNDPNAGPYYYRNQLGINPDKGTDFWKIYRLIYICNAAIEGLNASNSVSAKIKVQLLGETKFMRAFLYFYLVNCFGNVPLAVTSDYATNATKGNTTQSEVYKQIIDDLKEAQELLSPDFLNSTLLNVSMDRVRPNRSAATAMLAKVYLYRKDYLNAEIEATKVIDRKSVYDTVSLNSVFLKNSREAIWQIQPTVTGHNTEDGWLFILNIAPGFDKPVHLSSFLTTAFEVGDQRKLSWVKDTSFSGITYSYPFKYKSATYNAPLTEYLMVLRLAEQYLIRAEARAYLGKLSGAVDDLNVIRLRAKLQGYTGAVTEAAIVSAILNERKVELFTEWGHRWFDLKRTGLIDNVMSTVTPLKGGGWSSYKQWFPIPYSEILLNPNLEQNSGY